MAASRNSSRSLHPILWLVLGTIGLANALQISYCSDQNTGSENGPYYWMYQSNGWCQDQCKSNFAYAVLQAGNCWCSNYAPYDQTDTGNCNVPCPGFKQELCGNQPEGLYGYFHLNIAPSGTAGQPSSATPTPDPSTVTSTVPVTVTTNLRLSTTSVQTTTTTSAAGSSNPAVLSFIPTPTTIVTTVQGSVQYITVTPTAPSSVGQDTGTVQQDNSFWSDTGKVAGTFTVVALVIVALFVGMGVYLWRRKKARTGETVGSVSDHEDAGEKRNSKHGLDKMFAGFGRRDSDERTPTGATPASMSRRTSHPMVTTSGTDERLNPNALLQMTQQNSSHVSVASLQDNKDYSRPILKVRNPDSQ